MVVVEVRTIVEMKGDVREGSGVVGKDVVSRGSVGRGGSDVVEGSVDNVNKGIVNNNNVNKGIVNNNETAVVEGSGGDVADLADLAPSAGHKFTKNYKGDKNYVPGREFYDGMDLVTLEKAEKAKLLAQINNCKLKVERSMVSLFGSVDAMDMFVEPGSRKVRYIFGCPIEGCDFRGNNLSRHLSGKRHGWSTEKAKLTHSYRVRLFNYVTKVDKNGVS